MKPFVLAPLIAVVTLSPMSSGAAPEAAGRVQLLAPAAERFRDFRAREPETDAGRQGLLSRLQRYLDERAGPRLADGTRLEVTLLDVDMAGEFEPNARGEQVRVVRDLYAPRIELSYRILGGDGRALCEGRRKLADPNFLRHTNIADATDALRYEKALLDDWATRDVPCAPPRVAVTFGDTSKFTDFRVSTMRSSPVERDSLAQVLRQFLEQRGPERIPPDTRLQVMITDVDLAGDYRLGGVGPNEVRVVKDMYPPRIDLDFKLLGADGKVEKEGHRELRDSAFMMGASPVAVESMRFEKDLLDNWLQKEFAPPKRSANAK